MALPPELEREIFELAVGMETRNAPILMLVAKRVYTWISPLMYMDIALGRFASDYADALFMRTFTLKPGPFFARTVRSVCMTRRVSNDTAECILSECKGTQRLAWWADETDHAIHLNAHLVAAFSNLKELSCGRRLFDSVSALHELTHLELILWDVQTVSIAAKFPRLTHFSLVTGYLDQLLGNFVGAVLEDCPGLRVFSVQFEAVEDEEGLHMQTWRTDPRVVVSFRDLSEPTRAWLEGNRWTFTERTIEERRVLGDRALPSSYVVDTC